MPIIAQACSTDSGSQTSPPARHLPGGEAGIWLVILGDMTVFTIVFGAYLRVRSHTPALFDAAQQELGRGLGAINTVLLLCSSLMVVWGVRAMRAGLRGVAPWTFATAMSLGLGFAVIKISEWCQHANAAESVTAQQFWRYYYIMTGLHFFHLCIGMVLLLFMLFQARKAQISAGRLNLVEAAGCFWHMVDLLWFVIFALLYLVR